MPGLLSGDMENQVELEEKTRLINQVLELQHTLEGNIIDTKTQTKKLTLEDSIMDLP